MIIDPPQILVSMTSICVKCECGKISKTLYQCYKRSLKKHGKYLCMSCAVRSKLKDPKYKSKIQEILIARNKSESHRKSTSEKIKRHWKGEYGSETRERMKSDDYKSKMSESVKKVHLRPETKKKYLEGSRRVHASTEYIEKLKKISEKLWENEAYILKCKTGTDSTQSHNKLSESSKKKWQDDDYRNKIIMGIRSRFKDPIFYERWLSIIRSEENKRKLAEARFNSNVGLTVCSKPHKIVCELLNDLGIKYEVEYAIGFYNFDIFIPEHKLLIEINGDYWHNLPKAIRNDKSKSTYIHNYFSGLKLVTIWEHEIKCKDMILDKLKNYLGLTLSQQVDVDFKKLKVEKVESKEADMFLSKYHYLRGIGRGAISYGCFYEDKLIAVSCFAHVVRKETATSLNVQNKEIRELSRFCIHPHFHKRNLATWFLSRACKMVKSEIVKLKVLVSFADSTFNHTGTIYKASNWVMDKIVPPSYWYVSEDGYVMHKKTLWDHAKSLKMSENDFALLYKYKRVDGKEKYRYVFKFK